MEASIANIPEMPDLALFEACVTSDDEAFQTAARKELIAVRAYSDSDIEDEIDRILDRRARASRDAMDLPNDWEPDYDARAVARTPDCGVSGEVLVSKLLLLQLFRRRHPFGSELFTFFDRAICHCLGIIDQCPPSTTELLYSRASYHRIEDALNTHSIIDIVAGSAERIEDPEPSCPVSGDPDCGASMVQDVVVHPEDARIEF